MLPPRETFPRVLMKSELPRGMAELSGMAGLLTPSRGENLARLSLPCHPLPACWRRRWHRGPLPPWDAFLLQMPGLL